MKVRYEDGGTQERSSRAMFEFYGNLLESWKLYHCSVAYAAKSLAVSCRRCDGRGELLEPFRLTVTTNVTG